MEAGVPLGEFWAIGKTGQEQDPALASPSKAAGRQSLCVFAVGSRVWREGPGAPAPTRTRQVAPPPPGLPARGPISAQRFPTCRAERASQTNQRRTNLRPFPERPAISKSRALGSRLPLPPEAGRQVSHSNCGQ